MIHLDLRSVLELPEPEQSVRLFELLLGPAEALKAGDLVVMPTETVYGLAASVYDEIAIKRTFRLKGRPADNPLIVHVCEREHLNLVARSFPPEAFDLVESFWPGPLTLVLPKKPNIPGVATAGRDTVAVRMPDHPVALKLIELADSPLTAPSANRFMEVSPTRAEHIHPDLHRGLAFILNGGPCAVGIESTVLDLTGEPTILRHGEITAEQISEVIGGEVRENAGADESGPRAAPGRYRRHYAPKTKLILVEEFPENGKGLRIARKSSSFQILMPGNPRDYARELYEALHQLDQLGLEFAYVELPPARVPGWEAVRERLTKAAEPA